MSKAALADNVLPSHTELSIDSMPGKCVLLFILAADDES